LINRHKFATDAIEWHCDSCKGKEILVNGQYLMGYVIGKIRIRNEKSSVVATLFSDLGLTVVNNTFCSPTDTIMQPSRVADFGALAQSAGFRIEDLANFGTSMWLCAQSDRLLIT
jgi:hypothetical protein